MHRETEHTGISARVKAAVARRDSFDGHCCCILCGSPNAAPNAHIIRRSQGGMGVEENIISLCPACHRALDEGARSRELMAMVLDYIRTCYPDWTPEGVTWRKWRGKQ